MSDVGLQIEKNKQLFIIITFRQIAILLRSELFADISDLWLHSVTLFKLPSIPNGKDNKSDNPNASRL